MKNYEEEEDDDYMSNALIVEDVKPGMGTSREGKRQLRINARRDDAQRRDEERKPMSKDELERQRLEEGIRKPICAESKGFKLLAMMGYKDGMSLGRKRKEEEDQNSTAAPSGSREGIKVPIPLQVKMDRSGIGLEEERREKQKSVCEAHMQAMQRQARMEEELAIDFRRRKRYIAEQKQLISDIQSLRKTCQEMDIRSNKEGPDEFWFWPIYLNSNKSGGLLMDEMEDNFEEKGPTGCQMKKAKMEEELQKGEEAEEVRYTYSNGKEAPMGINLFEFDVEWLRESLSKIIAYMRSTHLYCVYCGCDFASDEEMGSHCAGPSREDHE